MSRHIGIVACSAEGAALCYRTICAEAPPLMAEYRHPEISMHTFPLADYMGPIRSGDWDAVAGLMSESARRLAAAGAEFAVCPDNTIHQAYDAAVKDSPIPWLHIAEEVAKAAHVLGFSRLGVLGTEVLMNGPVYPGTLEKFGISCRMPDPKDRARIDGVIYSELINGVIRGRSRSLLNRVIGKLREQGCEAAVLGCTEIPLLIVPEDSPLPVLDSTRILARAALREALKE